MIRDLRARLNNTDDLTAWRRACDKAYAESRRSSLRMMTTAEVEARLGYKLGPNEGKP